MGAPAHSLNMFVALGSYVYIQVLRYLNITFVVVDGEADNVLVEIANFYDCPVLSNDSDFYMYKLKGGYVPMDRFHRFANSFEAEVYYYEDFCAFFQIDEKAYDGQSSRLIIVALAGNDFFPALIDRNDKYRSYIDQRVQLNGVRCHPLRSIIRYAFLFYSLESFMDKIQHFPHLSDAQKVELWENCKKSQKSYDSDRTLTIDDILAVSELRTCKGECFPPWAMMNYRKGQFCKFLCAMTVSQKYAFHMFIDDTTRETSVLISRPIRRYIYGILGSNSFTEYIRVNQQLSSEEITPNPFIDGCPLPQLSGISSLSLGERRSLLYSLLGCHESVIEELKDYWKLVLAATVFWCK